MAIAAGKSAGKPPRMADKACKPPTEAAIAMTGYELIAVETEVFGRPDLVARCMTFFAILCFAGCFFMEMCFRRSVEAWCSAKVYANG